MKLTKSKLQQLIREELEKLMPGGHPQPRQAFRGGAVRKGAAKDLGPMIEAPGAALEFVLSNIKQAKRDIARQKNYDAAGKIKEAYREMKAIDLGRSKRGQEVSLGSERAGTISISKETSKRVLEELHPAYDQIGGTVDDEDRYRTHTPTENPSYFQNEAAASGREGYEFTKEVTDSLDEALAAVVDLLKKDRPMTGAGSTELPAASPSPRIARGPSPAERYGTFGRKD